MKTKRMGYIKAGDVIETDSRESGDHIIVTIKSFSFDPTWPGDGLLIYYHHEPSGEDGCITGGNLKSWFNDTVWIKTKSGDDRIS